MTTYQKINEAARSTQDDIKVRYTAKTHTSGGRRGGVSRSEDGRLDVKFSAPAAWKTKPSWFVIAGNDRAVSPELETAESTAMKATSITLPSSHVPMLSHPKEVADFIEQAAAKAGIQ